MNRYKILFGSLLFAFALLAFVGYSKRQPNVAPLESPMPVTITRAGDTVYFGSEGINWSDTYAGLQLAAAMKQESSAGEFRGQWEESGMGGHWSTAVVYKRATHALYWQTNSCEMDEGCNFEDFRFTSVTDRALQNTTNGQKSFSALADYGRRLSSHRHIQKK